MKKIISILAVLLGFTSIIAVSAKENELEINVGIPKIITEQKMFNYGSIGIHGVSYSSDMIGFGASLEFLKEFSVTNLETNQTLAVDTTGVFEMKSSCGLSIRVLNNEKASVAVTPAVDFMMLMNNSALYILVGPEVQLSGTYKITSMIGITGRCDLTYYMYAFSDTGDSGKFQWLMVDPQIGVTIYF